MSLKRIAVLIVTGLVVLILQQPLKLTGGAGVSGSSGTVLLAQSRPPTIAKLASDARKFSVKVPGGHLLGASANPAYTYAMSDGSPAPKLVTGPDGELYLGYNDADSNARVVLLGENFRIERSIVQIKGKRLEDFVADDDGVALLLTEFDSEQKQNYISRQHHTAHIEKFTSKGRAIFRTRIVGTREYKQEGDQGIDTTFGTFSIVHDASEDTYATYFSTYRRWDDGITHQSEYLALFDGDHGERRMRSDRANPEGFTWNVSHSFRPRFVHDGERFVMATVGDAYPRGFVVQFFPQGKRELPVKVPKAKPGETYQYVPVSTGDLYARDEQTWIVFDSAVGKSDYDIALALVEGDSVGKPIYLTNTNRSRERIPRIVPFGREHFLVLWMN
ncbi:MAG: ankyrin repeat domain-containing protein, partial [Leptospirales bacterium]